MNRFNSKVPWFALFLIVFGFVLLMDKLEIFNFNFSHLFWPIVMLFGLGRVVNGFNRDHRGTIFFGTLLFFYGLFFFLYSLDYVNLRFHIFIPATFLIFGIAFIMLYLQNLRDWFLLIPAFLLCIVGLAFIFSEYGYLYPWEIWELIRLYWPIVLIIVGIGIIFRRNPSSQPTRLNS